MAWPKISLQKCLLEDNQTFGLVWFIWKFKRKHTRTHKQPPTNKRHPTGAKRLKGNHNENSISNKDMSTDKLKTYFHRSPLATSSCSVIRALCVYMLNVFNQMITLFSILGRGIIRKKKMSEDFSMEEEWPQCRVLADLCHEQTRLMDSWSRYAGRQVGLRQVDLLVQRRKPDDPIYTGRGIKSLCNDL